MGYVKTIKVLLISQLQISFRNGWNQGYNFRVNVQVLPTNGKISVGGVGAPRWRTGGYVHRN